jgi:DNA-binding transcriptional MerR regulator
MQSTTYSIGELAARTGVAPSALRYYEEIGLLPTAPRVSGQRRYGAAAAEHVGTILLLRDVGFSLAEIKALVRSRSGEAWRRLARAKLAELEARIARAEAARLALEHAVRCPHVDVRECPNFAGLLSARLAGARLDAAHTP